MGLKHTKSGIRSVVIADDHEIVRQGVVQVLQEIENIKIAAQADNGVAAIAAVKIHKPDLLVLDAAMPLARGIEVYAEARRWSPDTRIILFTGFKSLNLLSDWLDAGVDGVLLKTCTAQEMKTGFATVLNGGAYIAETVQDMLKNATVRIELTAREREVLSMISSGHANIAIADRLHISPKTVEKHRASLMSKLNVHSVAELLSYALREGLLDEHRQL